jgi:hypothetical protein
MFIHELLIFDLKKKVQFDLPKIRVEINDYI